MGLPPTSRMTILIPVQALVYEGPTRYGEQCVQTQKAGVEHNGQPLHVALPFDLPLSL